MIGDTSDDDGTNSPEHLQHLSSRSSQLNWRNLTAVRGRVGDEDAPWDTLEELGDEHDGKRVGEVEDEDEGVQHHECGNSRPAISNAAGKGTSQADTDDCTYWSTHLESRLPAGYDDLLVVDRAVSTIGIGKRGKGDEVSHQENTVGFHNLHIMLAGFLSLFFGHIDWVGGRGD